MPPVVSTLRSYDPEWAQSVVGLRLKVPDWWWNGCNGRTLHPAKVTGVVLDDDNQCYFRFKLNDKGDPRPWPIRYDALLAYADFEHETFPQFRLPTRPPIDPALDRVARVRRVARAPVFNDDSSDDEPSSSDDEPSSRRRRLNNGEYASMEEEDIEELSKYLNTGRTHPPAVFRAVPHMESAFVRLPFT